MAGRPQLLSLFIEDLMEGGAAVAVQGEGGLGIRPVRPENRKRNDVESPGMRRCKPDARCAAFLAPA